MRDEMNYNAAIRVIFVRTKDVSSEAMMVVEKHKASHNKDDEAMRREEHAQPVATLYKLFPTTFDRMRQLITLKTQTSATETRVFMMWKSSFRSIVIL
jgi:hypothetical protein